MTRVRRYILNVLTAISLLLAAWLAWLQIENYNTMDGGFAVKYRTNPWFHRAYYHFYLLDFPIRYWHAAFVLCLPAVIRAFVMYGRWRGGRSRALIGLCPVCNYDLRATRDRCPECGTKFKTTQPPMRRR